MVEGSGPKPHGDKFHDDDGAHRTVAPSWYVGNVEVWKSDLRKHQEGHGLQAWIAELLGETT